ncbi:MAG: class I SAM-dependent methyltransferase [Proteobacteria bacterium]|nr:class I SAM-dependent methyltransferase [Desulfobacula sp.]MBU4132363.1 class I SAM-dependent methyltransferase [Pseudomonadota bacterium]
MYNKEFKGDVCSHSHSFFLDNFIRRIIQNPKKILGDYIQKGDTIVDLGCGPGYFSLDMAKMTGRTGKVIAVDLQQEMLAKVGKKAAKENLSDRIHLHNCTQDRIGLNQGTQADFILAFYMVHETPDTGAFLEQVKELLRPGGLFLLVEPVFHVSKIQFETIMETAIKTGFILVDRPKKKGGRSLLLSI